MKGSPFTVVKKSMVMEMNNTYIDDNDDKTAIDVFKRLMGLDDDSYEIYRILLERKEVRAADLASLTSLSRVRIYQILNTLEEKGLITSEGGRPRIYRALNPSSLIDDMKREVEDAIERAEGILSSIYSSGGDIGGVVSVTGNMEDVLASLIANASISIEIYLSDVIMPPLKLASLLGKRRDREIRIFLSGRAKSYRMALSAYDIREGDLDANVFIFDSSRALFSSGGRWYMLNDPGICAIMARGLWR